MRGQTKWNNFVANTEKEFESTSLFKAKVKPKLPYFENEINFLKNNCRSLFFFYFFIVSKIEYITIE